MSTKVRVDAAEHSPESVAEDSLQIVGNEIRRLKAEVRAGGALDLDKAKLLQIYVDLALRLAKEKRDGSMTHRLDELSDDKLDALLQDATEYVKKTRGKAQ